MFNLDDVTNEDNKDQNTKWAYITDHPYRMLLIGGFGSGKTNALFFNKRTRWPYWQDFLYAKDLNEPKYQFFINKREDVRIKHLNDPKTFIEYSAYMDDVYNNIPADTRRPGNVPWRSPKGPNVRDLQGTFRGLLADQQKNWWFNDKSIF